MLIHSSLSLLCCIWSRSFLALSAENVQFTDETKKAACMCKFITVSTINNCLACQQDEQFHLTFSLTKMMVTCCCYSTQDECLAFGLENQIIILNLLTRSPLATIPCTSTPIFLEYSHDLQLCVYVLANSPEIVVVHSLADSDYVCLHLFSFSSQYV